MYNAVAACLLVGKGNFFFDAVSKKQASSQLGRFAFGRL